MPTLPEQRRIRRRARERFARARRVETWYSRILRKIAHQVETLIKGFDFERDEAPSELMRALFRYSEILEPWARATAGRMLADVNARDIKAWREMGHEMGALLRREIETAPTGRIMQKALSNQVSLISSLPREAAQRVHKLTTEAIVTGRRAKDIATELLETADITRNRADLIARTEVSRTAAALTRARAEHLGSDSYQWLSAGDADVRPAHKKLNGKTFRWNDPPIAEANGVRHHPGEFPNCRCIALPILAEEYFLRPQVAA